MSLLLFFYVKAHEATARAQSVLSAIEAFKIGWGKYVLSTTASIGLASLKPGQR